MSFSLPVVGYLLKKGLLKKGGSQALHDPLPTLLAELFEWVLHPHRLIWGIIHESGDTSLLAHEGQASLIISSHGQTSNRPFATVGHMTDNF